MSPLQKKFPEEIAHILAKYPSERRQASVMPLLHLAQRESGFVSRLDMQEIADIAGISVTEVASVVGFYTLFHNESAGKIRVQVCTDVACDLRGAKEYLKSLCAELGINPGETTKDCMITIEEVKCLAACDRAPMFQSQIGGGIEFHENQTPERTLDWLRSMSAGFKKSAKTADAGEGGIHE
jgi:NADH-quinone oxidoreductase subunit E